MRHSSIDLEYRRIVATADEGRAFYLEYPRAAEIETVELRFGVQKDAAQRDASAQGLRVIVDVAVIEMMHAWVRQRSEGFTLEVQGRFLAKRRPEGLHIDDFVPLPSFCQSLAYETTVPKDRQQRFGQARMRAPARRHVDHRALDGHRNRRDHAARPVLV